VAGEFRPALDVEEDGLLEAMFPTTASCRSDPAARFAAIDSLTRDGRSEVLVGSWGNGAGRANAGAANVLYSGPDWIGAA
jgi:hypothetical protein